ncbi:MULTISPECIES: nuclear transport factor 2 family protein [Tabrizicola]|uniref:nuclear transport factor 2 family protein n=1 Tax=Tabrizicola TaxID=1443919 RepID=UPI001082155C|nr:MULTISPECIES: nuclear transport factor 2 family protein [Paracoccaceae]
MTKIAEPVVHIHDDRFKVTEWRFSPGAETGWHRHEHDYVIVPLTDGTLTLDMPDGQRAQAQLRQGVPYSRRVGVEHNVTNGSSVAPLSFLEIEVVDDALARKRRATMERLMAAFNMRDLDGLMACMSANCAFHAAAGPDAEGRVHRGREAVRTAYAAIFDTFPQAAWTEGAHVVAGDTGLSTWRFVGTTRDGVSVDVRGCDVFAFEGDLIALKDSYRKARG